jgi:hypothetical protein
MVAFAVGGMGLAGCKPTKTENAAPAAVELTATDLSGVANLTNGDRKAFTDQCFARRGELFTSFTNKASLSPNDFRDLKSNLDVTFPNFCDCLEKELEKGLSKMQFMMAKSMVDQGAFITYPGSPMPAFEPLKKAAAQRGMSDSGFEVARQDFRKHASHSSEACFLQLWLPSATRKNR